MLDSLELALGCWQGATLGRGEVACKSRSLMNVLQLEGTATAKALVWVVHGTQRWRPRLVRSPVGSSMGTNSLAVQQLPGTPRLWPTSRRQFLEQSCLAIPAACLGRT